jgi:glycosyltransferase involved in cell wall biosynthesis
MQKKIAIIVPAKGNAQYLDKCVRSLVESNYFNFETIIVDDGLDEESLRSLKTFKDKIRILQSEGRGPSYARNLAAKNCDADFIAFTDSDCIVSKSWIAELLRGFEEFPEAVSCGGVQYLPEDATDFEAKIFYFMQKTGFVADYARQGKSDAITKVNHNASCNAMYKRDVFLKEGGFLESLWPAEDVELDYRLKKKKCLLVFNPKAIVRHYRPKNLKAFSRMMYRYGFAQGLLVEKHGPFRRMHFLPFVGLGLLILLAYIPFNYFLSLLAFIILALLCLHLYFGSNFAITRIAVAAFMNWLWGFLRGLLSFKTKN